MRVLDLFSGIGGFSLGLERAGMQTVAFCEINPYCRDVLRAHWPDVPIHEDITALRGSDVGPVDVICGGFPCQDISDAGPRKGLEGARSGLWSEYRRLIEEIRPAWVVIENVAALRGRGLGTVLREISALGYDAEWHCVPASAVGAPHRRDRVWIIAYAPSARLHAGAQPGLHQDEASAGPRHVELERLCGARALGAVADTALVTERESAKEAHAVTASREARSVTGGDGKPLAYADCQPPIWTSIARQECHPWSVEPAMGRVVDGVSHKVVEPELRALGNAVVPQIPEMIGRAIMCAAGLN